MRLLSFWFFLFRQFFRNKPENKNSKNYNDEFLAEFNEQYLFQSKDTPKQNIQKHLDNLLRVFFSGKTKSEIRKII